MSAHLRCSFCENGGLILCFRPGSFVIHPESPIVCHCRSGLFDGRRTLAIQCVLNLLHELMYARVLVVDGGR